MSINNKPWIKALKKLVFNTPKLITFICGSLGVCFCGALIVVLIGMNIGLTSMLPLYLFPIHAVVAIGIALLVYTGTRQKIDAFIMSVLCGLFWPLVVLAAIICCTVYYAQDIWSKIYNWSKEEK